MKLNDETLTAALGCEGPLETLRRHRDKWILCDRGRSIALSVSRFRSDEALSRFRENRERLLRETGAAGNLCIPRFRKVVRWRGSTLLVEEMPLGSERPCDALWERALLEGIRAMHAAGWAHMDIKPEHLLWVEGRWRLIDFDSAMPLGTRFSKREVTFAYAPPEVYSCQTADGVDDLYAAALALYRRVNGGRLPFEFHSERAAGWLRRHVRYIPAPSEGGERQTAFFRKALAFKRSERFQTIEEFYLAWMSAMGFESE